MSSRTDLWIPCVVDVAGRQWAAVMLQPVNDKMHRALTLRLRTAGFKKVSAGELNRALWPYAASSAWLYTAPGDGRPVISHLHTGATRIQPTEPIDVPDRWLSVLAAQERVLFAMTPPNVFDEYTEGVERDLGELADALSAVIADMAGQRRLLAAMVKTMHIDKPMPPWPLGGRLVR